MEDFSGVALHTYTNQPWTLPECIEAYARRGIGGLSIWRNVLEGEDLCQIPRQLRDAGLEGISLVRGGFFTGGTRAARRVGLEDTRQALREAEMLELPSLVLVCGATVGQTPQENYRQIADALGELADEAEGRGVRLLVEPLHPVYAGDRSGISSLRVANDLCAELDHENIGIALDVYHVWWELDLRLQIQRAAEGGWLETYHICDFKPDQDDLLTDRGIMGEGCVALKEIDRWMSEAGFEGKREVEIFSKKWWGRDQEEFLDQILSAYHNIYQ